MKRRCVTTALAAALAWGVASSTVGASPQAGQEQGDKGVEPAMPLCPVMGEPVDFGASLATDEGPVFFCCPKCINKYKADPSKYADKVAAQRKLLADRPKVQTICPVSGKPADPKVYTEYRGRKVYFCCPDCIAPFTKDPDKYQARLANSYTYQTKCPVMGGEIDPQAFTVLPTGLKVFYCCQKCDKKFLADPAKYAPNLAAQGIHIDPAKIKTGDKEPAHDTHQGHEGQGH